MTVSFDYYVEDIDTQIATYDQVRLWRGTSPTGSFTTQAATATLVAGQKLYTLSDSGGDVNSVYVVDFHHSTLGNTSTQSAPFYPDGVSLLRLRLEAARKSGAGFDSTCSALGTTTTLVDAALLDNGVDADYGSGLWLYRPFASLGTDRLRRVALSGFDTTTGTFTVTRAYSNAPAATEVYHAFMFYPPIRSAGAAMSWDDIIRDALRDTWYVDQLDIGTGTATGTTTTTTARFSLSDTADVQRSQVRRILIRTFDANGNPIDRDANTQQGVTQFVPDGAGNLSIDVYPAPLTTEHVIVEVNRQPTALYNDADVVDIPIDYAVAAVRRRLYWQRNSDQAGKYTAELAAATADFAKASTLNQPNVVQRGL